MTISIWKYDNKLWLAQANWSYEGNSLSITKPTNNKSSNRHKLDNVSNSRPIVCWVTLSIKTSRGSDALSRVIRSLLKSFFHFASININCFMQLRFSRVIWMAHSFQFSGGETLFIWMFLDFLAICGAWPRKTRPERITPNRVLSGPFGISQIDVVQIVLVIASIQMFQSLIRSNLMPQSHRLTHRFPIVWTDSWRRSDSQKLTFIGFSISPYSDGKQDSSPHVLESLSSKLSPD
jgi:hypothetical protein